MVHSTELLAREVVGLGVEVVLVEVAARAALHAHESTD